MGTFEGCNDCKKYGLKIIFHEFSFDAFIIVLLLQLQEMDFILIELIWTTFLNLSIRMAMFLRLWNRFSNRLSKAIIFVLLLMEQAVSRMFERLLYNAEKFNQLHLYL